MIFAVSKFIAGLFGWDISRVQKYVLLTVFIVILLIIAISGLWLRSCLKKQPKLEIKNIEKINSANKTERLEELAKTATENADVVKTVDGRNAIAELDEASRQAAIWAKINAADEKIQAAKSQGRDVTGPELECILTGACN